MCSRSLLVAAVLAALMGNVHAETTWICGLDRDWVNLHCVADEEALPAAPADTGATTAINGTAFPLDARRAYRIPLWSPASDGEMLRQLADAAMCYRTADCRVILAGLPAALTATPTRLSRR